mgnify:CR=1 FL=1
MQLRPISIRLKLTHDTKISTHPLQKDGCFGSADIELLDRHLIRTKHPLPGHQFSRNSHFNMIPGGTVERSVGYSSERKTDAWSLCKTLFHKSKIIPFPTLLIFTAAVGFGAVLGDIVTILLKSYHGGTKLQHPNGLSVEIYEQRQCKLKHERAKPCIDRTYTCPRGRIFISRTGTRWVFDLIT